MSRPYRLRVELAQRGGEQHLVQFDGKKITIFNPLQNVYEVAAIAIGVAALGAMGEYATGESSAQQSTSTAPTTVYTDTAAPFTIK
ncbi:MAG: hypothetical protein NMNS01_24540 [Nitrosomonas sp.]|nr:MAG: hypothetical protein NMNS01_24540 [Nitrosomonas sp.]